MNNSMVSVEPTIPKTGAADGNAADRSTHAIDDASLHFIGCLGVEQAEDHFNSRHEFLGHQIRIPAKAVQTLLGKDKLQRWLPVSAGFRGRNVALGSDLDNSFNTNELHVSITIQKVLTDDFRPPFLAVS
jgi:hypothetical protein